MGESVDRARGRAARRRKSARAEARARARRWCGGAVGGAPTGGAGRPAGRRVGGCDRGRGRQGPGGWCWGFQIVRLHRSPATQQPPRASDRRDHGLSCAVGYSAARARLARRAACWVDPAAVGYAPTVLGAAAVAVGSVRGRRGGGLRAVQQPQRVAAPAAGGPGLSGPGWPWLLGRSARASRWRPLPASRHTGPAGSVAGLR